MLPKNKASRAQQYLMYFYSNGGVLLFQLYYNKNIVVFLYSNKSSSRFTSHSSYSEIVLKPKKKGRVPTAYKGLQEPSQGGSPVSTQRDRNVKKHLGKAVFLQLSAKVENTQKTNNLG